MFYSIETFKKKYKSPKISVLNIPEREISEEEELRDKINHNYFNSQYCSISPSPHISINQSLKMLSDDKKPDLVEPSPEHSL